MPPTTISKTTSPLGKEEEKQLSDANKSAKMSMAERTRAQEEPLRTTIKLSDYYKNKSTELQTSRDNPRSNNGPQGRSGTQPGSRPTCTFGNYQGDGSSREERQQGCRAYDKTCNKCSKLGHFRAACRSGPKINSTSNEKANNAKNYMGTVGVLPKPQSFNVTHQCGNRQKCKKWFYDPQIQPDRAKIHRWHQTKDNKHPKLVAEVTLCHNAYDKIRIDPPNAAEEKHKIWSPPCQT